MCKFYCLNFSIQFFFNLILVFCYCSLCPPVDTVPQTVVEFIPGSPDHPRLDLRTLLLCPPVDTIPQTVVELIPGAPDHPRLDLRTLLLCPPVDTIPQTVVELIPGAPDHSRLGLNKPGTFIFSEQVLLVFSLIF